MTARRKPLSRTNKPDESKKVYCRRCMEMKSEKDFFQAVDTELDRNKIMSVCRKCCDELYNNNFTIERNFEKALLRTCKMLNIAWNAEAVISAKKHVDKFIADGKTDIQVFGIYKSKLMTMTKSQELQTFTFEEYPSAESIKTNTPEQEEDLSYQDLKSFWGDTKTYEEIDYLQNEFNALGGLVSEDRPKAILLRELCFLLLEVKNKRDGKQSVDKELKTIAELMQNSAIRPDQKKVADGNKSSEAFGVWLADIEKYNPTEWYKDQSIYKDVNNIKEYWDVNILRPFLNFWGAQKNFDFEGAVERSDNPENVENPDFNEE
jgi:hypothetical protein